MKKLLYVLLFAFATSMTITSCTDEAVKPRTDNGSGGASDPIIKK